MVEQKSFPIKLKGHLRQIASDAQRYRDYLGNVHTEASMSLRTHDTNEHVLAFHSKRPAKIADLLRTLVLMLMPRKDQCGCCSEE